MSSLSDSHTDFDLWDTICCSKCLLPFLSKAGPTIPFWLTECGHILCNNHLSKQKDFTLPDSPSLRYQVPIKVVHNVALMIFSLPLSKKRFPIPLVFDQCSCNHAFIDGSTDVRVVSSGSIGIGCNYLLRQGSNL